MKNTIKMFWVTVDPKLNLGKISYYVLPDGCVVSYNEKKEHINVDVLNHYIGYPVDYYYDGVFKYKAFIKLIGEEDGIKYVRLEKLEEVS